MIVLTAVTNSKTQHYIANKRRLRKGCAARPEILASTKLQLINTCNQCITLQQGLITTAIVIGLDCF